MLAAWGSYHHPRARLAAQLRSLSKFTMSESEAAQAADNLVGFVRLLAEIGGRGAERGDEDASDRSRHRVREPKKRADRVRQRSHQA